MSAVGTKVYASRCIAPNITPTIVMSSHSFFIPEKHLTRNPRQKNSSHTAGITATRNIARTVDAVAKQIAAVEKLRDHGILDGLPDDLRMTGELRLKHDEASLAELASYHLPPISKSGLNHRLSRLMERAEKLK